MQEYIDRESGARSDRPAFRRLFEDARRHRFSVVVFWSLDRFSREGIRPTLTALHHLAQIGVTVKSFTEPHIDTTTPIGELLTAFLASLAALERQRLRERVKSGMDRARAEGKAIGRPKRIIDLVGLREMWRVKQLSISQIAVQTGLPRSTLYRRLQLYARGEKPKTTQQRKATQKETARHGPNLSNG